MADKGVKENAAPAAEGLFASGLDTRAFVLLALGFGCMIGYARLCSFGFVDSPVVGPSASDNPWYALRTAMELALLIAIAFVGRQGRFSIGLRTLVATGACAVASAIIFAVDPTGSLGALVAVLSGASSALFMYMWMLMLCNYAPRAIVAITLIGLVLAGVLIGGAQLVGKDLGLIITVAAAFGAGACAVLIDPDLESCKSDGAFSPSTSLRMPWLTVIMIVACGFFVSVLYGIARYMTWLYSWDPNYPVFGIAIVFALVATALIMLRSRSWIYVVWAPLFLLFALSIVFACIPIRALGRIAVALMLASVFSAHFLYWMIFPAMFSTLKVPRTFAAGIILVCMNSSLASLVGDAIGASLPASMQSLGSVAGIMAIVVALLFAATFVVSHNRVGAFGVWTGDARGAGKSGKAQERGAEATLRSDGQGRDGSSAAALANGSSPASHDAGAESASPAPAPIDILKSRLDDFGAQFGLTPRELEVALYTVQGYSCAYIADKLVVSNSTVRFHQQNIFRKFEVHSRNELIEYVSAE